MFFCQLPTVVAVDFRLVFREMQSSPAEELNLFTLIGCFSAVQPSLLTKQSYFTAGQVLLGYTPAFVSIDQWHAILSLGYFITETQEQNPRLQARVADVLCETHRLFECGRSEAPTQVRGIYLTIVG